MKIKLRLLAFVMAFVMVFTVIASGCGSKASFNESVQLEPLTATVQDKNIFMYNPDRGFRTDVVIRAEELLPYVNNESKMMKELSSIFNVYFGGLKEPCSLAFAYVYFTPWHDKELSEDALKVLEWIFEYCRIRKYKLFLCICYNESYALNFGLSDENKEKLASECADEKTILKHIDQFAPVIAEYKDCIFNIKSGFIGYVGEWAFNYQYPEVDYNKIAMAIVEKLCVPNDLYFSIRSPGYKLAIEEKYPDWPYFDYIGFNNCAMYGEQTHPNWNSGCYQLGHNGGSKETGCSSAGHNANDLWEYTTKVAAYVPVTGEMFTAKSMNKQNTIPTGKEMILELVHHRHVTFSFWHCKYDTTLGYTNIMEGWERQEVNKEWLDAQKIVYDPNWFVDANGNPVSRNCYEFIRDHLGYKLVGSSFNTKTEGGKIKADLTFKNYGFSAVFNLVSGFAILDDKYNVVSEVNVGEPKTWHSHDPDDPQSTVVPDYTISGELDIPEEKGTYYVSFYLKNTMGIGAQLSNNVMFENNQNVLFAFNVK